MSDLSGGRRCIEERLERRNELNRTFKRDDIQAGSNAGNQKSHAGAISCFIEDRQEDEIEQGVQDENKAKEGHVGFQADNIAFRIGIDLDADDRKRDSDQDFKDLDDGDETASCLDHIPLVDRQRYRKKDIPILPPLQENEKDRQTGVNEGNKVGICRNQQHQAQKGKNEERRMPGEPEFFDKEVSHQNHFLSM